MRQLIGVAAVFLSLSCAPKPRLNVVLVTIDTCRADRLSCYGYDFLQTPNIDRLAAEGVLFEQARTCVPITLPSHTSILTGCYPSVHGVRENGGYRAADSLRTLSEVLKDEGYETAAFVGAFPLDSRFNLDQGFDHYGDSFEERGGEESQGPGGFSIFYSERPASAVNEEFFAWLRDNDREPFFAWLHYFDPHQPFEPRPPYDALCAGRPYDAEIAFVDECIGQLTSRLEARSMLERTVFVVTADHGEALGEHGEISHALLLHDATLKVPLIVRCPARLGVHGRVSQPVRTVDIAATVLDLIDADQSIRGTSLVPLMRGHGEAPRGHLFETYYGRVHFGWSVLFAYDLDGWRIVHGPRHALYDLSADPGENRDVHDQYAEKAADLEERMSQESGFGSATHSLFVDRDASTAARLQALGYVGSWEEVGPAESLFTGPDPRDMMGAHRLYDQARGFVHRGMWPEAIDSYRATVKADPGNGDARVGLVQALIHIGETRAALESARDITIYHPSIVEGWLLLARLLLFHDSPGEALVAAQQALAVGADPVDGWLVIGQARERSGDTRGAVEAYGHALKDDESNLKARLGRARSFAMLGDTDGARLDFDATLRDNPYWPAAQYDYGVFLTETGDTAGAIERFERAALLSPDYVAAHHALALLLSEQGHYERAIPHLEAVVSYSGDANRRASAERLLAQLRESERAGE